MCDIFLVTLNDGLLLKTLEILIEYKSHVIEVIRLDCLLDWVHIAELVTFQKLLHGGSAGWVFIETFADDVS